MKIQFTIEPSDDTDEYREIYTATMVLPNNAEVTVRASEDDVSFDGFRADVLTDILESLCQTVGLELEIDTEDYAYDVEADLDENFGQVLPFPQLAPPLTTADYGDTRADGC